MLSAHPMYREKKRLLGDVVLEVYLCQELAFKFLLDYRTPPIPTTLYPSLYMDSLKQYGCSTSLPTHCIGKRLLGDVVLEVCLHQELALPVPASATGDDVTGSTKSCFSQ